MITADQAIGVARKYNTGSTGRSSFTPPPPPTVARASSSNIKQGLINTSTPQFQNIARVARGGLGKLGDALNAPSFYTEKFLTGGKGYEETLKNKKVINTVKFINPVLGKALENPYGRAATSFSARLIADPLNLVGIGIGKALKLPEAGRKIVQGVSKLTNANRDRQIMGKVIQGAEKAKDFVGNKLVYGYKTPEKFMKQYEGVQNVMSGRNVEKASNVAKPLFFDKAGKPLATETQQKLGDVFKVLTGADNRALSADEIKFVNQNRPIVEKTLKTFENLADKQIKYGVPENIFSKMKGSYSGKRMFSNLSDKTPQPFVKTGGMGLDESVYKGRKSLSEESLQRLGEIKEPAYGAATAALTEMNNIDKLKFFRKTAQYVVSEGGELLPKSTRYGVLSGQRLPKEVAQYVKAMAEPIKNTNYSKIISAFKRNKTIYSIPQLVRNVAASQVQAFMNPSGKGNSMRRIPEAIREIRSKGKYYQEAKNTGLLGHTMASTELAQYAPDALKQFTKSKLLGSKTLGKVRDVAHKAGSWVQNTNEEMAKLQVFINERKAGKSVAQATKAAEETGFAYHKVTPFISNLRSGRSKLGPLPFSIPFATYGLKAAELSAKTLAKKPVRLANIAKAEKAVESVTTDEAPDEQYIPDYQKDSVRTPFKNKDGNFKYLNSKYVYPYGNLFNQDSGYLNMPLGLSPDPIYSESVALGLNKDTFTKRDVTKYPGPLGLFDKGKHFAKTFLPPAFGRTPDKFINSAVKNKTYATTPSLSEAALQELGLPIFSYDEASGASFDAYNRKEEISKNKKAIKDLRRDWDGVLPEKALSVLEDYYVKKIEEIASR